MLGPGVMTIPNATMAMLAAAAAEIMRQVCRNGSAEVTAVTRRSGRQHAERLDVLSDAVPTIPVPRTHDHLPLGADLLAHRPDGSRHGLPQESERGLLVTRTRLPR